MLPGQNSNFRAGADAQALPVWSFSTESLVEGRGMKATILEKLKKK